MKLMSSLILVLFVASPALAENNAYVELVEQVISIIEQAQDTCHETAVSTIDMRGCESQAYDSLDSLLNREYQTILANSSNFDHGDLQTNEQLVEDFRASQRAWLAFRQANCKWQSNDAYGGTMQPLLATGCSNRMTKERIIEMVKAYNSGL
ncbi:MAG: DUF1311 domain-containing protein [Bdellovibrionales bacterium]|nr:DUF1311 domain-containing protein [Bdellovibrionales bacterium]NQZ18666.1 DUF1311 domain-containing protein [Bdellovibrionales bacterium]